MIRIFLLIFLSFEIIFCQVFLNPTIDNYLKKGVDKLLRQDYEKADSIFTEIEKTDVNESIGLLFRAASKIIYTIDFRTKLNSEFVDNLLERAEKVNEVRFKDDNESEKALYYKGLIEGIRAYAAYAESDYILAFKKGYKALKFFDKLQEKNNADAQIAIGIYKFWISRKTEFVSFLPFMKDEKQEGIELLKTGISKNTYIKFLGINSLAWILIDQKRSGEALSVTKDMLINYPELRFILWAEARAYEDIDISKAILLYKKLLYSVKNSGQNGYNEVVLLHILAQKEYQRNNYQEALEFLDQTYLVKIDNDTYKRLDSRFERIIKLKKEIEQIKNSKK